MSFTTSATSCGYPLKLEPQFVERVWGAENLELLYASHPLERKRIGEVWLTGDQNRVANGAHAGKTLQELTSACGPSLLGAGRSGAHPSGAPVFPLLVKFLFTTDKLSVQVHPTDAYAATQQSWGKTEMWHILRAESGARLAVGFRPDVPHDLLQDAAKLRAAATSGGIEQMLDWQEVRAGETFFVPAGTVHAIGPGLTLCEIQQNSDITYRLYDYNRPGTDGRPRPLHIEQALAVINRKSCGGRTAPFVWPGGASARQLLAACPYFVTERWDCVQPLRSALGRASRDSDAFPFRETNRLEIWIALEGAAEFEAGGERATARQGEVVIIPADAATCSVRPLAPSVFLRTFPPNWEPNGENDVVAPLRAAGATPEQLRQVCFPLSKELKGSAR
jgi:mannose-6-phosphate isomerase